MKISILGAGNIGGTLGRKWAAQGHDVVFGVRDVNAAKVEQLLDATEGRATAASVADAVAGVEVVLLAIPGQAVESTLAALGGKLDGKIIIDATNNVGQPVMNSLATVRAHAPGARLFRAFSNLGWENFAEPVFDGVQADLFYCGDSGQARTTVEALIADVGLRPVYVGDLDQVPVIDSLTRLWFALALQQGYGRHMAFKMLKG
jgi:hypothetical protein